jgi:hypothetical protein
VQLVLTDLRVHKEYRVILGHKAYKDCREILEQQALPVGTSMETAYVMRQQKISTLIPSVMRWIVQAPQVRKGCRVYREQ